MIPAAWLLLGLAAAAEPAPGRVLTLAIVDDAFLLDHDDLRGLWARNTREVPGDGVDDDRDGRVDDFVGWDASDGDGDVGPPVDRLSDFAHGTFLAGVAAGVVREALGAGADDAVRLLPIKALGDRSDRPWLLDGFDGIDVAVAMGADIVLCAWSQADLDPGQRAALDRAHAAGVLVVASAGNLGGDTPQYPAAYEGVLSVAALDAADQKLARSSFGVTVDLAALGEDVEGSDAADARGRRRDSGTSPAAALVAGAAAVLWHEHPKWTASEVRAALEAGARPVMTDDPRLAASLGAGALDLAASRATSPWTPRAIASSASGSLPLQGARGRPTTLSLVPPGDLVGVHLSLDPIHATPALLRSARLEVHAGPSAADPLVWEGALDTFPGDLLVPSRRVYARFTPGSPRLAAFLRFRAEPLDVATRWCRGTVELDAPGVLEDGSGDAPYAPATDCKWLITAPEGQVVRFTVDALDTEPLVDQVLFFLGPSTAGRMMAGFSGGELPPELVTWGRQVLVWFVTDVNDQRGGWRAHFTFEPETR